MFQPGDIDYTSCFCEENVYKLTEKASKSGFADSTYVVFISSESKCTPIWYQKSSSSVEEPVCWDYHVILIVKGEGQNNKEQMPFVYDLDSLLPFPSSFDQYFEKSFRPSIQFNPEYMQVVPALQFLNQFASDRSHMLNSGKSFPEWPLIRGSLATVDMNLHTFMNVSFNEGVGYGVVYSRDEFRKWTKS